MGDDAPTKFDKDAGRGDDDAYLKLLNKGLKVAAVKLYKERTGLSLRECKDAIDALDADRKNK